MRLFLSAAPPAGSGSGGSGRDTPSTSQAVATYVNRAKPAAEHPLLEVISPLNAIVGFASMLADSGHDLAPEVRHRYAVRVRDAADTLQRMMATLVQALEGKELDLSEDWVSSGTFRVAPMAKGLGAETVETTHESVPPPPDADAKLASALGARPRVFVVDADESNRELLAEYLGSRGYDLVLAGSGEDALQQAEQRPPDLVLIDPMMPRENGFEIARLLKASNPGGFVPLVFVTALVDDDSRMRALDAGAEQMVKKPVNRHELRARVKSLLQLRAHQETLAVQNAQLKSLQRFKDETTAMLVHDLKSPLSAMMMNLDFALDDLPARTETADIHSALAESRAAGSKLFRMIANLLDIARSDDGRLLPKRGVLEVNALFQRVTAEHAAEAQARTVTITHSVELDGPISADPDLIGRVLANLIENALRYTYAGGKITLGARRAITSSGATVELTVTNDGRPISDEWRAVVFEKYAQVSQSQAASRGLGLYFCRVAVEAHGGRIELLGGDSPVTCFRIELPQA
jgi:two-component system sensor histidine kinase/response regulator